MRRIGALLVAGVLAAAGCGDDDAGGGAGGPVTLKVAETAGVPSAFLQYGLSRGTFRREGLELEVEPGQGGAAAISSLVGGDVQVAGSNVVSVLVAGTKGVPIRMIAPGTFASPQREQDFAAVMVARDSPIRSLRDLEGKTVAVNTLDNINELTLRKILADAGVDGSKIKLIEVPFPDMQSALERGRVDVINPIEPFVTRARAGGERVIGSPYWGTRPGMQIGAFVMTAQYLQEHADTARRFRRAVGATARAIADDPAAFRRFLARQKAVPAPLAPKVALPVWQERVDRASLDLVASLVTRFGLAEKAPPVAELIAEGAAR